MATFFGSEALVSYTTFNAAVSGPGVLYTVPEGFYAEIFIMSTESSTGTLGYVYRVGNNAPISVEFSLGSSTNRYGGVFEVFENQTFNILSLTGADLLQVQYRVKLFAKP